MNALDTKVLARFFVDDPDDRQAAQQRPAAVAALSQRAWVSVTVLLEFEWVLRGFYELPRKDVLRVLRALVGIEHVSVESRAEVLAALDAVELAAMDFADALHLARAGRCAALLSFDKRLVKRAQLAGLGPPVVLPSA